MRRPLGRIAFSDSTSSCLAYFGWGQNAPNTLRLLPSKNHKLRSLFYIAAAAKKFLKGV